MSGLALVGNVVFVANFVNAACLLAMQLWGVLSLFRAYGALAETRP